MIKHYLYSVATDKAHGFFVPLVQFILWLLSWCFRIIVCIRNALYAIGILRRHKLPRPVICVGNITVGGVGKTPLVEYIARYLCSKDLKPVILTRGYMEQTKDCDNQTSDEAVMLQDSLENVPVLVGADRVKSAKTYLEHNPADIFILDDGFQRHRIRRDLDIVAIDATNPWGNGHLLPRGLLREGLQSLKRANIIVLTKADLAQQDIEKIETRIKSIHPGSFVVKAIHKPIGFVDSQTEDLNSLDLIKGEKVSALSSIGAPKSFEQTLKTLDCRLVKHYIFMDHHRYAEHDIQIMVEDCLRHGVATIITTEKDKVKLKHFRNLFPDTIRLLALKVNIAITDGESAFLERITRLS